MVPTLDFLAERFDYFNEKFFDGWLNPVNFDFCKTKHVFGYYTPAKKTISICKYYDRPQKSWENTIIHEMCHVYQHQVLNVCDHGKTFYELAAKIRKIDPTVIITAVTEETPALSDSSVNANKVDDFIYAVVNGTVYLSKINSNYSERLMRLMNKMTNYEPHSISLRHNRETFHFPKSRTTLHFRRYTEKEFSEKISQYIVK